MFNEHNISNFSDLFLTVLFKELEKSSNNKKKKPKKQSIFGQFMDKIIKIIFLIQKEPKVSF